MIFYDPNTHAEIHVIEGVVKLPLEFINNGQLISETLCSHLLHPIPSGFKRECVEVSFLPGDEIGYKLIDKQQFFNLPNNLPPIS